MAPILPIGGAKQFCVRISSKERLNAGTIKRNSGGRRCVEVWWRMHFHHPDFYYRLLAAWLCELLMCFRAQAQRMQRSKHALRLFSLRPLRLCAKNSEKLQVTN